jgi:hypothetical protein
MAPFEEDHNGSLKRAGHGLLEFVRRERSYHYVIDRFGRVFRIVEEGDKAFHAGNSVWADSDWIYSGLNDSFFGVAFEAQTRPADEVSPVNSAQVHAARILTDMLRSRYGIAPENCVAHAQVSVNPSNGRAAFHTDWSAHLPFEELGLPDNYRRPLPSMVLFGFAFDGALADEGSAGFRQMLLSVETEIHNEAAAHGLTVEHYRQSLLQRYRDVVGALHAQRNP